jgi:hypothetical protein
MTDEQYGALRASLGELKGTNTAILQTLADLRADGIRTQADVGAKHDQNVKKLDEHLAHDDVRFDELKSVIWKWGGALAVLQVLAVAIALPLLLKLYTPTVTRNEVVRTEQGSCFEGNLKKCRNVKSAPELWPARSQLFSAGS